VFEALITGNRKHSRELVLDLRIFVSMGKGEILLKMAHLGRKIGILITVLFLVFCRFDTARAAGLDESRLMRHNRKSHRIEDKNALRPAKRLSSSLYRSQIDSSFKRISKIKGSLPTLPNKAIFGGSKIRTRALSNSYKKSMSNFNSLNKQRILRKDTLRNNLGQSKIINKKIGAIGSKTLSGGGLRLRNQIDNSRIKSRLATRSLGRLNTTQITPSSTAIGIINSHNFLPDILSERTGIIQINKDLLALNGMLTTQNNRASPQERWSDAASAFAHQV